MTRNAVPFTPDDVADVAALFADVFRRGIDVDAGALSEYLREIYFQCPWHDPDIPSWVTRDRDGTLTGFLGVIPRRWTHGGSTIRVAVAGNVMVRADAGGKRNPLSALQMTRSFLAGPQDLSLTDTASDTSRQLWEGCGGDTASVFSLWFAIPFRPAAHTVTRFTGERSWSRRGLLPLAKLTDWLLGGTQKGPYRRTSFEGALEPLTPEGLIPLIHGAVADGAGPDYSVADLTWLLDMASRKKAWGALRARRVTTAQGRDLGGFLYYQNPEGPSQLLQIVSHPKVRGDVLDACLADARRCSSWGLSGRAHPAFLGEISSRNGLLSAGPWILVHSRHPELISAFHDGSAFFSGLEGELWTRFDGDTFATGR